MHTEALDQKLAEDIPFIIITFIINKFKFDFSVPWRRYNGLILWAFISSPWKLII